MTRRERAGLKQADCWDWVENGDLNFSRKAHHSEEREENDRKKRKMTRQILLMPTKKIKVELFFFYSQLHYRKGLMLFAPVPNHYAEQWQHKEK